MGNISPQRREMVIIFYAPATSHPEFEAAGKEVETGFLCVCHFARRESGIKVNHKVLLFNVFEKCVLLEGTGPHKASTPHRKIRAP